MMKPANDDPEASAAEFRRRGEELIAKAARAATDAERAEVMREFGVLKAEFEEHIASQKRDLEQMNERQAAAEAELRRRGIDPDAER